MLILKNKNGIQLKNGKKIKNGNRLLYIWINVNREVLINNRLWSTLILAHNFMEFNRNILSYLIFSYFFNNLSHIGSR